MEIVQSPLFKRAYKKLHGQELKTTNMAIKSIMANPEIGTEKQQKTGHNVRIISGAVDGT